MAKREITPVYTLLELLQDSMNVSLNEITAVTIDVHYYESMLIGAPANKQLISVIAQEKTKIINARRRIEFLERWIEAEKKGEPMPVATVEAKADAPAEEAGAATEGDGEGVASTEAAQ